MGNYTVLIIDYEPRSIERSRSALTSAGFRVHVATDGLAGIETFGHLKPDLVLVEAMLPKRHGFEVCQDLKKTPQGKRTPIAITTAVYKGRKYRNQAIHIYGCDDYIEKPIADEDLVATCRRLLGDRESAVEVTSPPPADVPLALPEKSSPAQPASSSLFSGISANEIEARLDQILPGVARDPGENGHTASAVRAEAEVSDRAALVEALPEMLDLDSDAEPEVEVLDPDASVEMAPAQEATDPNTSTADDTPAGSRNGTRRRSKKNRRAPARSGGNQNQVIRFDARKRKQRHSKESAHTLAPLSGSSGAATAVALPQPSPQGKPEPKTPPVPAAQARPQEQRLPLPLPHLPAPADRVSQHAPDPRLLWVLAAVAVWIVGYLLFKLL
jgi:DNA-binding response OmpR family regulator